jgi:hypothetical protein
MIKLRHQTLLNEESTRGDIDWVYCPIGLNIEEELLKRLLSALSQN